MTDKEYIDRMYIKILTSGIFKTDAIQETIDTVRKSCAEAYKNRGEIWFIENYNTILSAPIQEDL